MLAEKKADHPLQAEQAKDPRAVSMNVSFDQVIQCVEIGRPLRRPSRCHPHPTPDSDLQAELSNWEEAGLEVWDSLGDVE